MNENIKDKIIFFLLGVLLGIATTIFGGIYAYKMVKGGGVASSKAPAAQQAPKFSLGDSKTLQLSFENKEDLGFFQPSEKATLSIVDSHATEGNNSLQVTIPAGSEYPGLEWETYGKDTISFKGKSAFSLNVYNNTEDIIPIEVKFKSGKNYPKKSYALPFVLQPLQDNHISVPVDQLAEALDVSQISYIKIFTKSPPVNFYLYIDEIKLK